MQPIRTIRQIRRPGDKALAGLALRDNFGTRGDFPAHGERGRPAELVPRGLTGPHNHRLIKKMAGCPGRQGVDDDFQRRFIGHTTVTLTVQIFGLDSQLFGFGKKVHSARSLHATGQDVTKFFRCRKRIAVFNSRVALAFPGNQCLAIGFVYRSGASPFPQTKRDVTSMSMASP